MGTRQIEVLHADKRALDKVLTQRQGELDELHSRLKASMVRYWRRRSKGAAAQDLQMFATGTWQGCMEHEHSRSKAVGLPRGVRQRRYTVPRLQDKIVALTDAGTEADARAHVAQAAANRAELQRSRLEQVSISYVRHRCMHKCSAVVGMARRGVQVSLGQCGQR